MTKSLLSVALAVASVAHADIIPFSATSSDTATANGNSVQFDGSLSLPGFDPALGTLNSVNFRLDATGRLLQDVITPSAYSFQDFVVDGTLSFMGVGHAVHSFELVYPCSPLPSTACTIMPNINYAPAGQGIFFSMWGTLTPELSDFKAWGGLGVRTFTTRPGDLTGFIGSLPIDLPVSSIANVSGGWSGQLQSQQQTGWNLSGAYDYTPTPQTVHTPESRWYGAILLIALMGFRLCRSTERRNNSRLVDSSN